jgi:hypothetical protein
LKKKKKGYIITIINPLTYFFSIELMIILYSIPCLIGMLIIQFILKTLLKTKYLMKNRKIKSKFDKERFISLLLTLLIFQIVALISGILFI